MTMVRWFYGFECANCGFSLLVHEEKNGGNALDPPVGPLIIHCTNFQCGHVQDYEGCVQKKFCIEIQ
jgi:hypothetical protein